MLPRKATRVAAASGSPTVNRLSTLGLMAGDSLVIPAGQTWLNDLATCPSLSSLTVNGTLDRDTTMAVKLTAGSITVANGGALLSGTDSSRPTYGYDIVVNGAVPAGRILGPSHDTSNVSRNTPNDGGGSARGIMVMDGGRLEMFGQHVAVTQTTLVAHAAAAATSIRVAGNVYWKAGWKFTLGMSALLKSISQANVTEVYTVASDTVPAGDGTTTIAIQESGGVTYARWGLLQYATGAGMSLTNDGFTAANLVGHVSSSLTSTQRTAMAAAINAAITTYGIPTVLDQRAPVALLTRPGLTISAPNDSSFSGNERFGVHTMKMGHTGTFILKDAEVFNCGQGGALGRYPLHFHLNSIVANTSTILGDVATGSHVIDSCSIHASHNRAVSIHAIHNSQFTNNVCHDIKGAAIFLEDGSEIHNTITGNAVTHVRDPGNSATTQAPLGYRIKLFDSDAAGLWISNVGNRVKFNRVSDAHVGRWASLATQCFGFSYLTPIYPNATPVLEFSDNIYHACLVNGAQLDHPILDEQGTQTTNQFRPTTNGLIGGPDTDLSGSLFQRETLFHNAGDTTRYAESAGGGGNAGNGNYINGAYQPHYVNWITTDCLGTDFSGNTMFGISEGHLMVAKSLNKDPAQDASATNYGYVTSERCGFASYHGLLTIRNLLAVGYKDGDLKPSFHNHLFCGNALMRSNDLYLNDPETLGANNTGHFYIDTVGYWRDPGFGFLRYPTTPPNYAAAGAVDDTGYSGHYLSTAFYDKDGAIGGQMMADSYIVPDHPFWTYGLSGLVAPYQINVSSYSWISPTVHFGIEPYDLPGLGAPGQSQDTDGRYWGGITYTKANPSDFSATTNAATYQQINSGGSAGSIFSGQHVSLAKGSAVRIRQTSNYSGHAGQAGQITMYLYNLFRTVHSGWGSDDYIFLSVAWPTASPDPSTVFITGDGYHIPSGTGTGKWCYLSKVANETALRALTGKQVGWCRGDDTSKNEIWIRVAWNVDGEGTVEGYPVSPSVNINSQYNSPGLLGLRV